MASVQQQIGPASIAAGFTRSTLALRAPQLCQRLSTAARPRRPLLKSQSQPTHQHVLGRRPFSQQQSQRPKADSKVHDSRIRWHPIPVALGVGFLGLFQFYKISTREEARIDDVEPNKRPKKRPRVRPDGPWYHQPHPSLR